MVGKINANASALVGSCLVRFFSMAAITLSIATVRSRFVWSLGMEAGRVGCARKISTNSVRVAMVSSPRIRRISGQPSNSTGFIAMKSCICTSICPSINCLISSLRRICVSGSPVTAACFLKLGRAGSPICKSAVAALSRCENLGALSCSMRELIFSCCSGVTVGGGGAGPVLVSVTSASVFVPSAVVGGLSAGTVCGPFPVSFWPAGVPPVNNCAFADCNPDLIGPTVGSRIVA